MAASIYTVCGYSFDWNSSPLLRGGVPQPSIRSRGWDVAVAFPTAGVRCFGEEGTFRIGSTLRPAASGRCIGKPWANGGYENSSIAPHKNFGGKGSRCSNRHREVDSGACEASHNEQQAKGLSLGRDLFIKRKKLRHAEPPLKGKCECKVLRHATGCRCK